MNVYLIVAFLMIFIVGVFYVTWLLNQLNEHKQHYKKLLHQKKSSEVLTGHIAEKFVPFLDEFKHDPRQSTFCGQPIDYIVFGDDCITIVEVKSGNARLNAKQKRIKKLVQEGKVEWEEIRIK